MGATRGMILKIFFITGASVGVIGTVFGAILGIAFALNIEEIRQLIERLTNTNVFSAEIYFLSQLPAEINTTEVVLVVGMALALSFLASIYPAWKAARLDPVEVLRYE
jgi:lipoprotein-releasing system permease protein